MGNTSSFYCIQCKKSYDFSKSKNRLEKAKQRKKCESCYSKTKKASKKTSKSRSVDRSKTTGKAKRAKPIDIQGKRRNDEETQQIIDYEDKMHRRRSDGYQYSHYIPPVINMYPIPF